MLTLMVPPIGMVRVVAIQKGINYNPTRECIVSTYNLLWIRGTQLIK